jgi:hypothetical protein
VTLRRYLVLGGVSFLLALVLLSPAATLNAWWSQREAGGAVQPLGLSGSLSSGHLSALTINGQAVASDVVWTLNPLWLLLGQLGFHIDGGGAQSMISSDLRLGPGSRVTFKNLEASTGLKTLLGAAGYPLPWIDGQVTLDLQRLKVHQGLPTDAEGKALLHAVSWGVGQATALGDFSVDIARDGDALVATLASISGPLELKGDARLGDDGAYEAKIQFKPRADAPANVQGLVRSTGTPDAGGYYHIDRHGSLKGSD